MHGRRIRNGRNHSLSCVFRSARAIRKIVTVQPRHSQNSRFRALCVCCAATFCSLTGAKLMNINTQKGLQAALLCEFMFMAELLQKLCL